MACIQVFAINIPVLCMHGQPSHNMHVNSSPRTHTKALCFSSLIAIGGFGMRLLINLPHPQ